MKVLRLTTLLDFGGQEKQYVSFTEDKPLLKYQYIFAAIGCGGSAEQTLIKRGFEVHVLGRDAAIRNLSNIWSVYKLIRKIKPDIVHTAAAEANFHGIIAAKLAGVKVVIGEEIGIPDHSVFAKKVFSLVYRLADSVICVSKSVKEYLLTTGEIPKGKAKVIYNPVSFSNDHTRTVNENFTLVFVGRLARVKNVKLLIKAFSKLQTDKIELLIIGEGTEKNSLQELAKQLDVHDRVHFKGFQKEPAKFIAQADLFVLPSISEGFGIAAVEAMFQKVPVLCSNVGGIPEFIIDNENGWLFDPQNLQQLTDKIRHIIHISAQERLLIASRGYDSVIQKFTTNKYIDSLEGFYKQMITK